jgi:hypothetical protein
LLFWVFAGLASAFSYRFASVAPVRGGTYFSLPPQRKVGKRKRAHTASACSYPRALHVPVSRAATFWFFFVASALNERLTRFNHFFNGARQRFARAHLRQTVCRLSHAQASAHRMFFGKNSALRTAKTYTPFAANGRLTSAGAGRDTSA